MFEFAEWLGSTPLSVAIQSRLWLFAVLGTVLAMLQLLVYSVLARQGQRSVYLVWGALVVLVGVGLTVTTLDGLIAVVLTVDSTLLVLLTLVSLYLVRHHTERPGSGFGIPAGPAGPVPPAADPAD